MLFESLLIGLPLAAAYIAWNERDKKLMKQQLNRTLCKKEVEHLIDLKNLPQEILQVETAKDIKEIKEKLDKLHDRLLDLPK